LEVVMPASVLTYPSLRRRLIAQRRSRALFLPLATQHVPRAVWLREVCRAAAALGGVVAWGGLLFVLAG
jgi:hypothetical protein